MKDLRHTEAYLWTTVEHRKPIFAPRRADCPRVAAEFVGTLRMSGADNHTVAQLLVIRTCEWQRGISILALRF